MGFTNQWLCNCFLPVLLTAAKYDCQDRGHCSLLSSPGLDPAIHKRRPLQWMAGSKPGHDIEKAHGAAAIQGNAAFATPVMPVHKVPLDHFAQWPPPPPPPGFGLRSMGVNKATTTNSIVSAKNTSAMAMTVACCRTICATFLVAASEASEPNCAI